LLDSLLQEIETMASQTGIECSEALLTFLGSCRDGRVRVVKVVIADSAKLELVVDASREAAGGWQEDWDSTVPGLLDSDQPCYLLYRLDEKDGETFLWTLVTWSPDMAHTRQKMLYAATKATFKKQFGDGQIKDDYYANQREDVSLAGYKKHLAHEAAPGPLSQQELEMKEIKESESRVEISINSKHNTLSALAFPFDQAALDSLQKYQAGQVDYVQLAIDLSGERVVLASAGQCSLAELGGRVPTDQARYHLFRFSHTHEGDSLQSNVFIYSMPGYAVPIKERMMYSSCRNAVVDVLEQTSGIPLDKKVEVDNGSELTEEFLYSELHPVVSLNRPKFSKPKGPSRGNKRITKTPA